MKRMIFNAEELEKYIFLTGKFNFETELLEHVSNDKLYKRIYEELNLCAKNQTRKGIIIEDTGFGGCYVGEIADDNTLRIIQLDSNLLKIVDINIADADELQIEVTKENFISEDNVKTILGQSISGTGNIGLYMHVLELIKSKAEYGDTEYKMLVTYYSSNDLKVDSLQDLTALTKASSTNKVILTGIAFYNAESGNPANTIYNDYCGVQFDGDNWRFRQITDTNTPTGALITEVSDIVTSI